MLLVLMRRTAQNADAMSICKVVVSPPRHEAEFIERNGVAPGRGFQALASLAKSTTDVAPRFPGGLEKTMALPLAQCGERRNG